MSSSEQSKDTREAKALAFATFGAQLGILFSRMSGILRTQVMAAVFGASLSLQAFGVAYRFANTLRDLFAEGALSSVFTKALVDARAIGPAEERLLISHVSGFFGLITLAIATAGFFFAREITVATTADSFAAKGGTDYVIPLFKILVFYLPLVTLSAITMSLLGVLRKTFHANIASAFFNVGSICGALLFAPLFKLFDSDPIFGLAWGTLLGGFGQWGYQAWHVWKNKLLPAPHLNIFSSLKYGPLQEILRTMVPRVIGQGAMALALLINTNFATGDEKAAMVYIQFAQVVIFVPVGLFGVAAGFSALPLLAEAVREKNGVRFSLLFGQSLHSVMWLSLFSIACFSVLAVPFSVLFFQYGRFTFDDSLGTALAICAYGMGIYFNSGSKVALQALYSFGQTKQVLINAFVYLFVNTFLSWVLSERYGFVGLGISYSVASGVDFLLNTLFLKKAFRKEFSDVPLFRDGNQDFSKRIGLMSFLSFAFGLSGIFLSQDFWGQIIKPDHLISLLSLLGVGGVLAVVFIVLVRFFGPPLLQGMVQRIGQKVTRRFRTSK